MMHSWGFTGGGFGAGYGAGRRFEEQYHCYSVAYADKSHLEVRSYFARAVVLNRLSSSSVSNNL